MQGPILAISRLRVEFQWIGWICGLDMFSFPIPSMGLVCGHLHEWLVFVVNVDKYTSPMDGMGFCLGRDGDIFEVN